ncbi:GNAT family N-acetyltransferase [Pelagibacterium limicola]|uniref:GNAT family N-acetyltransferase n=1 Tax=Pelagibacterium limicola TaxID=2791022 RepID=UPI001A9B1322|nr:GNAT family N-acetyltransferase [Pelagibacterium limicola]
MAPHIAPRWGWDDIYQREVHRRHYSVKPFFAIAKGERRIGTLSWWILPDHIRFGEFYLLPELHGRGWGTAILLHVLMLADSAERPVRCEYLRWNPVGSLYRRHGFEEIARSESHIFLERPARKIWRGPPT